MHITKRVYWHALYIFGNGLLDFEKNLACIVKIESDDLVLTPFVFCFLKQRVTKPMVENIEIDVPPKGTKYSDEPRVEVIEGNKHESLNVVGGQADLSQAEADLSAGKTQQSQDATPTQTTPAETTAANTTTSGNNGNWTTPSPPATAAYAAPAQQPAPQTPEAQPAQDTQTQYSQSQTQSYQDTQNQATQSQAAQPTQSYQDTQAQASQAQAAQPEATQTQATQDQAQPQAAQTQATQSYAQAQAAPGKAKNIIGNIFFLEEKSNSSRNFMLFQ